MIQNILTNPKYSGIRHAVVTGAIMMIVATLQAAAQVDWGSYNALIGAVLAFAVGQIKGIYTS